MQFIPATGRRYGLLTRSDLHDPLRSIDAAARYVRDLNMMFDGRIDLVLAGYNAGENAVINSGYKVPPYRETRSYVTRWRHHLHAHPVATGPPDSRRDRHMDQPRRHRRRI